MLSFRHFQDADADILLKSQLFNMTAEELKAMIRDWNRLEFQGRYFEMFAIVHGDAIVGMISLHQLSSSIVSIGPDIFPPFRRMGYGGEAMRMAIELAKGKGYRIVSHQVRSDNLASIHLHRSLSFETDEYGYINRKGHEVFIFLKTLF